MKLIEKAYEIFNSMKEVTNKKALEEYKIYFKQRLETILAETYSKDLILYVINTETNFSKIITKLEKLKELAKVEKFTSLINVLKRIKNIVKDSKSIEINEALFKEKAEYNLKDILNSLKDKNFSETIDILINSEKDINEFFDTVKINVDEKAISDNRLALLNNLLKLVGNIIEI